MLSKSDAILAGSFLARAIYGGGAIPQQWRNNEWYRNDEFPSLEDPFRYDDDYRAYLASQGTPWTVLTAGSDGLDPAFFSYAGNTLGSFTSGGLYLGNGSTPLTWNESNKAEALVAETWINGEKTLVLSFRGSDGGDAFWQAQTFNDKGAAAYYRALQPVIKAVLAYAADGANQISNVVVAGHSLGGTMADVFSLVGTSDPAIIGAQDFINAGLNLEVVSLASAGVPPRLSTELGLSHIYTVNGKIVGLNPQSFYTSVNHTGDRVYYAGQSGEEDGSGL
ncbi:MAG TPA: hypothetical protein ENK28_04015, partial [Aliiroseovarius sp.]|nr:hypothetical protein [Aliiroseovarius sp.]